MPLARFVVVEVVGRRDLDGAGAEFQVHENGIADDRNVAGRQRQANALADQMAITRVLGVDGDGRIAQHRLGPRSGDGQGGVRIIRQRIADVVHLASGVFVLDFDVGQCGEAARAPVDEPLAPIDQAVFV